MKKELNRKVDKLLKIKQVAQVYEKALTIPESKDFEKAYLLKEILIRFGSNQEFRAIEKDYEDLLKDLPTTGEEKPKYKPQNPEELEQFKERVKTYNKQAERLTNIIERSFDLALQLDKEKRLVITWPGEDDRFLQIGSQKHYFEFTKLLAAASFKTNEGDKWPSSKFDTAKGEAQLRPKELDHNPVFKNNIEGYQKVMMEKVMELEKHGHLTADVFDIITHKWLHAARNPEQAITVSVNDFLEIRGLKQLKRGDRRSGYTDEQRKQIARQLDVLENIYVVISEMDIYPKGKKKQKARGIRGRSIHIGLEGGQLDIDGNVKGDTWRVRPGDIFAYYFFEPYGRQTALLSIKAVEYDPYRQKWEKSLTRYLAWQWKTDKTKKRSGGKVGFKVNTLIRAASEEIYKRRPSRTRERLEEALDRLQVDGVISAWEYEDMNESITEKRGWWKEWLEWKIIITAPEDIIERYPRGKLKGGK